MLKIVCWHWGDKYSVEHVNRLASSIRRNLRLEHKFYCITDNWKGRSLKEGVIPLLTPTMPRNIQQWPMARRLWLFSDEASAFFAPRFVQFDIDTVITGDITPMLDRSEDFVIWRCPYHTKEPEKRTECYNPSLMLVNAGAREFIWRQFIADPVGEFAKAVANDWRPDFYDQEIISNLLWDEEATWDDRDGIYSFREHLARGEKPLPSDARIVSFYGKKADPSHKQVQEKCPWVRKHWK